MLPGFRFLFAATVLSMSMLIFGLGAAALLRAAHEEFAGIPSRRPPPEIFFAQNDKSVPTLAMLRVEPVAAEPKGQDAPVDVPTVEPSAITPTLTEPEKPEVASDKVATLDIAKPSENSSSSEPLKPEASAAEIPAQAEAPSPAIEAKVAAVAQVTSEMTSAEQASAPVDDSTGIAQTKIATLGGPPATITPETSVKKAEPKKAERSAAKKKLARRAKERRRIAARPRVVQQAPADPFAQPFGR